MNSKGQYKLYRSFRGAVLKSMRLLSSVDIQYGSVDVIPYVFDPLANSFDIDCTPSMSRSLAASIYCVSL